MKEVEKQVTQSENGNRHTTSLDCVCRCVSLSVPVETVCNQVLLPTGKMKVTNNND